MKKKWRRKLLREGAIGEWIRWGGERGRGKKNRVGGTERRRRRREEGWGEREVRGEGRRKENGRDKEWRANWSRNKLNGEEGDMEKYGGTEWRRIKNIRRGRTEQKDEKVEKENIGKHSGIRMKERRENNEV
jgi:hypothetical protein